MGTAAGARTVRRGLFGRAVTGAQALRAVLKDPDDTTEVFRLFDAVAGGESPRFVASFVASRAGARLLETKPDILSVLRDRAALASMPEGSLGRAYLAFMERDGLTADWLVGASEAVIPPTEDCDEAYIERRLRDTHDLWHVVTGYDGDLLGEGALLAFTFAQTWNAGVGVLISAGLLVASDPDARRLLADGFARGMRAAWLPGVSFEELLPRPLTEVRETLRVGPPPSYERFYARDLPPGGLLAKA